MGSHNNNSTMNPCGTICQTISIYWATRRYKHWTTKEMSKEADHQIDSLAHLLCHQLDDPQL